MSTDDVLSSIDEALWWEENWEEASSMRWTPDMPEENPTGPLRYMRGGVEVVLIADTSAFESAMIEATRRINAVFARMRESFRPFAEAMGKLVERMAARDRYDEHHPEPLVFQGRPFGAEYARRRKARGRRG